jgi:hypothetical protein
MYMSRTDSWGSVRQSFADQFEPDGANFIYRRSQKGEAIRVSAEEHRRFVDEFDRNVRSAKWIMYIGLTVLLGGIILFSALRGSDLSQLAILAGVGIVMIPYFVFFRWAWAAPARELGSRTPIAGERSREAVQRLKFQRITYGQLAIAALTGLAFPFLGSSRHDVLSGWNRLWLLCGGAILLLAAVQAFRKWRLEQEDSCRNVIPQSSSREGVEAADDTSSRSKGQLWRYVPLAVILLGLAFIAYTPAGKEIARRPSFWPILMVGFGAWALSTVIRGFTKGQIEPFARGFYNTYGRELQPKRFWASMAWNAVFGCFLLWGALHMAQQNGPSSVQDRCYDEENTYSQQDVTTACEQMLKESTAEIRKQPDDADAYFNRGYAYEHAGELGQAIADFSAVIRLTPNRADAYYYRWAAYKDLGDDKQAAADLESLTRLNPKFAAALREHH